MSTPIKSASDKYGKRFYVKPTGTPGEVRSLWLACPPDEEGWTDCTDMEDDEFETLILSFF